MVTEETVEKDYKLGCSILEAEVSKLKEENDELKEQVQNCAGVIELLEHELKSYKDCFPNMKSLADMSKMERLLKGFNKITESNLTKWGL